MRYNLSPAQWQSGARGFAEDDTHGQYRQPIALLILRNNRLLEVQVQSALEH